MAPQARSEIRSDHPVASHETINHSREACAASRGIYHNGREGLSSLRRREEDEVSTPFDRAENFTESHAHELVTNFDVYRTVRPPRSGLRRQDVSRLVGCERDLKRSGSFEFVWEHSLRALNALPWVA